MESCSLDISSENIATGTFAFTAAFLAIFRAKEVFPILGRAAMIIRSDFCKPDVRLSRRVKPVATPVSKLLFPSRSSRVSIFLLISLPIG